MTAIATSTESTATMSEIVHAEHLNDARTASLTRREWARTGQHGWRETADLHTLPGWHVFPGMVLQTKFDAKIGDLGIGDVRVIGKAQQISGPFTAWSILVESIETGERAVVHGRCASDSHEWHVTCPTYMTRTGDAFAAQFEHALSFSGERFEVL